MSTDVSYLRKVDSEAGAHASRRLFPVETSLEEALSDLSATFETEELVAIGALKRNQVGSNRSSC